MTVGADESPALPVGPEAAGAWWARLGSLKIPGLQAHLWVIRESPPNSPNDTTEFLQVQFYG